MLHFAAWPCNHLYTMRSINTSPTVSLAFATALFAQCAAAAAADNLYRPATPAATRVPRAEDLVRLPGTGWIAVSSMRGPNGEPGRLFLVNAAGAPQPRGLYPSDESRNQPDHDRFLRCSTPPDLREFYPHGLAVVAARGGAELYVVNHGGREAIEFFRIASDGAVPHATWIGCLPLPGHAFGNGVAPLPGGGLVVSNMYDTTDPDFLRKFAAAQPTGGVLQWTPNGGWREAASRPLSGANGVEVSADGSEIYVSEWAARKLWKFSLQAKIAPRSVDVDFLPDNLRWTGHGTLLLAGQNAKPEELFGCQARREPCPLGFTIAEIEPATLRIRVLFKGGDSTFGGATGALFVGRDLWAGSFLGELIGRFVPISRNP
jgi:hypothetical protein